VASQVQGISFESSDSNQAATPLDNHYSISIADELRKRANLRNEGVLIDADSR
jgi:hypothetical protein